MKMYFTPLKSAIVGTRDGRVLTRVKALSLVICPESFVICPSVTKRLSIYENTQHMESEEFFALSSKGKMANEMIFIAWDNDYRHYLALRQELEKRLGNAA